jgi:hypothetical protein
MVMMVDGKEGCGQIRLIWRDEKRDGHTATMTPLENVAKLSA